MEKHISVFCLLNFLLQQAGCEDLVNIALHKTPTQSGTLEYPVGSFWDVSHSVDGLTECTSVDGHHYSATALAETPWWQLDLGSIHTIKAMHILGRPDTYKQLGGFRLWAGLDKDNLSMVYKNNWRAYNNGNIWLNITIIARVIKIDLPRDNSADLLRAGPLTLCEVEVLISSTEHNIKYTSTTSCSGIYQSFGPHFAIDGKYPIVSTMTPDLCNCCSVTTGTGTLWWTIDFGQLRLIRRVDITGRMDQANQNQSKDLSIFISSTSPEPTSGLFGDLVWNITSSESGNFFKHIFPSPRVFRYMTITQPGSSTHYMTICEVDFNTVECQPGRYGFNCSDTCGQCIPNSTICSVSNGTCPTGCSPGLDYTRDQTCKTVCVSGQYGNNCSQICGHCINGTNTCQTTDGTCPFGCAPGYDPSDLTCKTECRPKHYGLNCSRDCGQCIHGTTSCLKNNGTCLDGCAPGYDPKDMTCNTESSPLDKCHPGQYGQNCEDTCGHCIDGNTTCSITDGSCLAGCASGYDYVIDMSCKTECQHGFYGLNCSETCGHCIHGATTCSVIDGTCPSGCKPGYNPADKTCKTGVNILRAPGFSRNTSQSSQYLDSDSSRAIDGFKGPDPETCKCCSQTQNAEVSWWQVDIGMVLPIGEIVLYGQNGNRLSLSGFSVYLSTSVSFPDVPFVKANDDVVNVTYHIDALGNNARYVRIQRNGVLIICEVEIFLSDKTCPQNTYTVYCIPCGHCYAGLPCDDITGRCPNGCETGYSGDTCNQAINTGTTYGTKDVIGAAIGGTIGGAIFILLIGMLVQRRNKLRCPWVCQTSQDYESPRPRENTDDQNMYDVLDIPDLSDQSVSGSMQCTEEVNPATPHYQNTNI